MKRALQVTMVILSLLPLTFGLLGLVLGPGRFLPAGPVPPSLDSQFRFMSSWYVALAVIVWWMIPHIEKHTALFRIVCAAVFVGGLARVLAWSQSGAPDTRFIVVLVLELTIPGLVVWQALVARGAQRADSGNG